MLTGHSFVWHDSLHPFALWRPARCDHACRWRALNRSLERVTAVHDAAQGADAGGILIDRVCEARDGMGYTQAHPPPPSAALQRASTVRADLAAEVGRVAAPASTDLPDGPDLAMGDGYMSVAGRVDEVAHVAASTAREALNCADAQELSAENAGIERAHASSDRAARKAAATHSPAAKACMAEGTTQQIPPACPSAATRAKQPPPQPPSNRKEASPAQQPKLIRISARLKRKMSPESCSGVGVAMQQAMPRKRSRHSLESSPGSGATSADSAPCQSPGRATPAQSSAASASALPHDRKADGVLRGSVPLQQLTGPIPAAPQVLDEGSGQIAQHTPLPQSPARSGLRRAPATPEAAMQGNESSDDSDADLLEPGPVRLVGVRTPRTRAAAAKRNVQDALALLDMQDKARPVCACMGGGRCADHSWPLCRDYSESSGACTPCQ